MIKLSINHQKIYTVVMFFIIVVMSTAHNPGSVITVLFFGLLMDILTEGSFSALKFSVPKEIKLIYFFLLYTLFLSLLNIGYLGEFFFIGIKRLAANLLILYFVGKVVDKLDMRCFAACIKGLIVVLGLMGIVEAAVKSPLWIEMIFPATEWSAVGVGILYGYRTFGIYTSPVLNGVFWGMLSLYCLMRPFRSIPEKAVYVFLTVFNLLMTKTRSAIIAVVFVGITYYLIKRRKMKSRFSKKTILGLGLVIITVIVLSVIYRDNLRSFWEQLYIRFISSMDVGSAGGKIIRLETLDIFFDYVMNHPLASLFGRGTYATNVYLSINPVQKGSWTWDYGMDNQFSTLVIESGIIGSLILGYAMFIFIKKAFGQEKKYGIMLGLQIIFFWIASFFYESMVILETYIFLVIVLWIIAQRGKVKEINADSKSGRPVKME